MKLKMLCSALAGASLLLSACGGSDGSSAAAPTKNVLFFLGDGMGITTMTFTPDGCLSIHCGTKPMRSIPCHVYY